MSKRHSICFLPLCVAATLVAAAPAHAGQGFVIEQLGKDFKFNTQTGRATQ